MYIETSVLTDVYTNSTKNDCLFKIAPTTARQVITNQTLHTSGTFSIAAGAMEPLPLGEVTDGRAIQIECDGDFNLTLNGFADALVCRRLMTTSRAVFRADCTVTSVSVSNPGAAAITGRYIIIGNPTA